MGNHVSCPTQPFFYLHSNFVSRLTDYQKEDLSVVSHWPTISYKNLTSFFKADDSNYACVPSELSSVTGSLIDLQTDSKKTKFNMTGIIPMT